MLINKRIAGITVLLFNKRIVRITGKIVMLTSTGLLYENLLTKIADFKKHKLKKKITVISRNRKKEKCYFH